LTHISHFSKLLGVFWSKCGIFYLQKVSKHWHCKNKLEREPSTAKCDRSCLSWTCAIQHLSFPTSCDIRHTFMVPKYFFSTLFKKKTFVFRNLSLQTSDTVLRSHCYWLHLINPVLSDPLICSFIHYLPSMCIIKYKLLTNWQACVHKYIMIWI
jgi:hypothetical protein